MEWHRIVTQDSTSRGSEGRKIAAFSYPPELWLPVAEGVLSQYLHGGSAAPVQFLGDSGGFSGAQIWKLDTSQGDAMSARLATRLADTRTIDVDPRQAVPDCRRRLPDCAQAMADAPRNHVGGLSGTPLGYVAVAPWRGQFRAGSHARETRGRLAGARPLPPLCAVRQVVVLRRASPRPWPGASP